MADFTLNAPGTTNNPWTPPNIITPAGGLKSDATGFRCVDSPPGTPCSFAHNVNYGPLIESTYTLATSGSPADDLMGGAVVRTGANAGALIGVWIESAGVSAGTLNPAGTFTSVSTSTTITRAASDVWDVTVSLSGGTATVTCKQNGTPITFNVNTTTTYATEASLAAGGAFSPFDNNTLYLSQFTGTGVVAGVLTTGPLAPWGPGVTPNTQTMFTPRPVSNFIVQGTSKAVASGQGFARGLLTGATIVPVIGYVRTSGPGISPDYRRQFDQIPRSTTLPNFAQLTGTAFGSGYALASLTGVAAIQGLSLGQGSATAGPLLGAGSLAGRASAEGNAFGLLGSGAVTSITGVALGSGYALGTVTGAGVLRGIASAEGTARATLTGTGVLSGQAVGQGFGRGTLLGSATLTGVGVGSGHAFGLAGAGGNLTGFALGSGYVNASLTGVGALAGRASAEGAAKGTMLGSGALRGTAHGQGSALATMQGAAQIQGVALGQAQALGLVLPVGAGDMQGLAAGFSYAYGDLTGGIHTFGYAVVTAVSQNGLPVARACYIEESASVVIASYFDNTGAPFVPNAVQYRIDDVASGANILPWTVLTPATSSEVTVTSAQNAMINNSRSSESHQVLFQVTDGLGNVTYADVKFDLIRVPGIN